MDVRDKARSDLWLAKLREQEKGESTEDDKTKENTAYNTHAGSDPYSIAEEGYSEEVKTPSKSGFQLQAAPKRQPKSPRTPKPLTLMSPPTSSGWQQADSFDAAAVPLPPTPAFIAPSQYKEPPVPPTPMSVRFNLTPSPEPSEK